MPNFDKCPEGMDYGQWLREKNIGIKVKLGIHKDSNLPKDIYAQLKHKNSELFERNVKRQGKQILPEDM